MTQRAITGANQLAQGTAAGYEDDLVRRAQSRDPQAWTEIYERYYQNIFRYMGARMGERETAEDLAATVFLEALKSIGSYRSRGRPFLAWLYTIARNVANYHYRSAFRKEGRPAGSESPRRPVLSLSSRASGSPSATLPGAGDPAAMVDAWDLREAISRLTEEQREVILLRFFVGLTTPQVAALLGKHERAVYSLQTRAVQSLRRRLA